MIAFTTGCGRSVISNPREVAGEYVFRYKTGEIEALILREDLSYCQELYSDVAAYRKHAPPKYTNIASWSYAKSDVKMTNFMMFCQYPNPGQRIDPPKHILMMTAFWQPPSSKWEASIWLSDAFHYVLLRVKDRREME
jgi:hypothetical protein